jgi:ABC-type branched-subunit amino acid transport system substrate-binding protein
MNKTAVAMSVAGLAVLFGSGCGEDTPAPIADKGTLEIRTMMSYTGPTSDNATVYYQGIKDALRDANDTGGIRGYKLNEVFYDHAYNLDLAQAKYNEWKADPSWSKILMFFSWGTPDTEMFAADALAEGKPFISGSYATTLATPTPQMRSVTLPDGTVQKFDTKGAPYDFFAGTDYSTQARIGMNFVRGRGGHKIAFAYCTTSAFCKEPIPPGKTYAAQIGLSISPDLAIELGDDQAMVDTKVQAYLKDHADVEWYWMGNSITSTTFLIKSLKKYAPTAKVISNMWGMDERTGGSPDDPSAVQPLGYCGADCVGNSFVIMSFAAFGDTRYTGMEAVVNLHRKWRQKDGDPADKWANVRYVQGYVSFHMFRRALESVVDSGKDVNGRNLKDAFEKFSKLESGGLTSPITFTPDDHRPTNIARIYSLNTHGKFQFEEEQSVPLQTDWLGW